MTDTLNCRRCGRPLRPGTPDSKARAIRRCAGKGLCPDCVLTLFLVAIEPIRQTLQVQGGPEALRLPHIQEQMAAVLKFTQLTPAEIDWERVIANWELPWSKREKGLFDGQ